MGADVDPATLIMLAADITCRHCLAQQRRKLEGTSATALEQAWAEYCDAAVGQQAFTLQASLAYPALRKREIAGRVMGRVIHKHQMRQAVQRPFQGGEIIVGPDIAIDHGKGLFADRKSVV